MPIRIQYKCLNCPNFRFLYKKKQQQEEKDKEKLNLHEKTVYLYDKIRLYSNKFATHSCQNRQQRHLLEIRTLFTVNHKMNFLLYFLAWLRRNQTSYVIHLTEKPFKPCYYTNLIVYYSLSIYIYIVNRICIVLLPTLNKLESFIFICSILYTRHYVHTCVVYI